MKLKDRKQSNNVQDVRGPWGAYANSPMAQRANIRRSQDFERKSQSLPDSNDPVSMRVKKDREDELFYRKLNAATRTRESVKSRKETKNGIR